MSTLNPPHLQPELITHEALQHLTGYERRADIERSLRSQGIAYFYGRYGIWTTITLINRAGGVGGGDSEFYYSPEII
ncbi:DUF4224 domain-containing protein [Stutzerimonas nitrititolerans]|uniref:DUF4224 domain-containing protein n=1 Tax=Stutzerimonas nitrititolerans TaxID=2482751 RepID=UPI0028B1E687|nr:DUF4224 domain-containing protein [Stutzerimonas nitrititolerans]